MEYTYYNNVLTVNEAFLNIFDYQPGQLVIDTTELYMTIHVFVNTHETKEKTFTLKLHFYQSVDEATKSLVDYQIYGGYHRVNQCIQTGKIYSDTQEVLTV